VIHDEPALGLSVVVPLYNEAGNVLPLAQKVFAALGSFGAQEGGMELVLVDDASTDETWSRMQEAQRADSRVRAIRHVKNAGQSAAVWTGCAASRGRLIATLDGDLQNDPADLPGMLKLMSECDMVCGMRMNRQDSAVRRLSSAIARAVRRSVLRSEFRDTGCALRVFKREVLEGLPRFNGLHRFLPILVQGSGARVREVPVSHHPRVAGKSKYGIGNRLGRGLWDLVGVRWFLKRQIRHQNTVESPAPRPASAGK